MEQLIGYVIMWVAAIAILSGCSAPFGIAIGREAIAAKVRIAELEHSAPMDFYTQAERKELARRAAQ